ncbi:FHA domain-containing protein [Janibacter sp. GS2]|uniref:FHA domain-containing protein n=1 Tax=Janibacter sp. GS2 TaxID=3442646 RepID=UPI003EBFFC33
METRIEGRDGWIEVTRAGVHVLTKGDDALRERLQAAVGEAGDEGLADVVTDELTTDGVRRTPDFAIVDEGAGRVLVRGSASVRLTGADGTAREVVAPARAPWADEDLDEGLQSAVLVTGEPEPRSEPDPQPSAGGWSLPSVFGAAGAGAAAQQPTRPPLSVVADDPAEPDAAPAVETDAPRDEDRVGEEDEELPSFDFLFGNTSRHRESLVSALEAQEEGEAPIDAGPVAAAGGYQAPQDPTNATLAPPAEDGDHGDGDAPAEREQAPADGGPISAVPGGPPPMPGSDPLSSAPGRVQAARDDATGHEPGAGFPQFTDGHLVGSRVPDGAASPSGSAGGPGLPQPVDQDGMISSVPWGDGAGPDRGSDAGGQATPDPAGGTGELPSGPMVLAVRCSSGHHNAPHATRCRVCGQELPSQQPEQTPRPALGLLRLSTGDVVTLDRGVLVGRAPRASTDASGARAPHLVRIASPDNEISRNHVEIVLDGWHVLVRDLGSTNGTTVALPGSSPVRVRPGDQQTIEPGTTITLADQVSMVFEVTG